MYYKSVVKSTVFGLNFMSPVKSLHDKKHGKGNDNVKMIKFTFWKTISVLTIVCMDQIHQAD